MTYTTPENIERERAVWEQSQLLELQRDEDWHTYTDDQRERIVADVKNRAHTCVERLLQAMDARDLDTIRSFLWKSNKQSCDLFARVTGLKLGRRQKSIDAALRQWFGPEAYDAAYAAKKQAHAEQRQAMDRREEERQQRQALAVKAKWTSVNDQQQNVPHEGTLQDFIDWCIASGCEPRAKRRGVTNELQLVRDGRAYTVRGNFRYLFAYAKAKHEEHLKTIEHAPA